MSCEVHSRPFDDTFICRKAKEYHLSFRKRLCFVQLSILLTSHRSIGNMMSKVVNDQKRFTLHYISNRTVD